MPAKGKAKARAGQGDIQSILFWTSDQANIVFGDQQRNVFLNGGWSTGKTLLMRQKALMCASDKPPKPLYFVVARAESAERASLLEMELKYFFHQEHNLPNVEVIGLPTTPEDTLSNLYKEVTTRPVGSWMVDELIMPKAKDHQQWAKELNDILSYLSAQTGPPLLWIVCSAIDQGETDHFDQDYMDTILPSDFYQLRTSMPLRNTKRVLELANLETNTCVKDLFAANKTNPVYKLPQNLMDGVKCKEFPTASRNNSEEIQNVIEMACRDVLGRTGGSGFPVLCDGWKISQMSSVKRGVEAAGVEVLVYHRYARGCSPEKDAEEWLTRRREGKERRCLITDEYISRGWENSHVLAITFYSTGGWENLVMRTIGYCALVKIK